MSEKPEKTGEEAHADNRLALAQDLAEKLHAAGFTPGKPIDDKSWLLAVIATGRTGRKVKVPSTDTQKIVFALLKNRH